MNQAESLNLSIGDVVPDARLAPGGYAGEVNLQGKSARIDISPSALRAIADHNYPILAELELYFSCLVRKQVRFRSMANARQAASACTRAMPGLYAAFRAVTARECRVADAGGQAPLETMPVKKPAQFVPDWIRIDYRAGRWRGDYGFTRKL